MIWRWLICRHPVLASIRATLTPFERLGPQRRRRSICRSFTNSHQIIGTNTCGGSTGEKTENRPIREVPMHWLAGLHQMKAQDAEGNSDPWRRALERDLPANVTCISTVALLDLLGLAPTTGNARRIAPTMRSMGSSTQVAPAYAGGKPRNHNPWLGTPLSRTQKIVPHYERQTGATGAAQLVAAQKSLVRGEKVKRRLRGIPCHLPTVSPCVTLTCEKVQRWDVADAGR